VVKAKNEQQKKRKKRRNGPGRDRNGEEQDYRDFVRSGKKRFKNRKGGGTSKVLVWGLVKRASSSRTNGEERYEKSARQGERKKERT